MDPPTDTVKKSDEGQTLVVPIVPFPLPEGVLSSLSSEGPQFGYGLLSQTVFLRSYSRVKPDGKHESWNDVVKRVMEGTWSIFNWHLKVHLLPIVNEKMGSGSWYEFLGGMANSMQKLEWLPAGRGLWIMGTDYVYQRGATALNNCAAVSTAGSLSSSAAWAMDTMMQGSGVGFDMLWEGTVHPVEEDDSSPYVIPDSREGWVAATRMVIDTYTGETPITGKVRARTQDSVLDSIAEGEGAYGTRVLRSFDYSHIRKRGEPIRGYGGISSGPQPLIDLHRRLRLFFRMYYEDEAWRRRKTEMNVGEVPPHEIRFLEAISELDEAVAGGSSHGRRLERYLEAAKMYLGVRRYDRTRLIVDVFNAIGACVVSGNVRRSSEIAIGSPESPTFLLLKNYHVYPEREPIGHCSNNTVQFTSTEQYPKYLPAIAERIRENGEPGLLFQLNVTRHGRLSRSPLAYVLPYSGNSGESSLMEMMRGREFEPDPATLSNPCGEICLESHEMCNLAEVPLTRFLITRNGDEDMGKGVRPSFDMERYLHAIKYATFYCKCVSVLPTLSVETNEVIARNHRLGVSLSGIANVYDSMGATALIEILKKGYRAVRNADAEISPKMGVPLSIRVTACKPSGTISLLTGASPGVHFPIGGRYVRRRVTIGNSLPIAAALRRIGVENEPTVTSPDCSCFSFYIDNGKVRSQEEVGLYELLTLVATVQREWADNMVSTTVAFDPVKEGPLLEQAIANFAPVLKSCAFLPSHSTPFPQMPYEAITREEYLRGISLQRDDIDLISLIDRAVDPEMPRYCDNSSCVL